jgi:hypothetical protein
LYWFVSWGWTYECGNSCMCALVYMNPLVGIALVVNDKCQKMVILHIYFRHLLTYFKSNFI